MQVGYSIGFLVRDEMVRDAAKQVDLFCSICRAPFSFSAWIMVVQLKDNRTLIAFSLKYQNRYIDLVLGWQRFKQ